MFVLRKRIDATSTLHSHTAREGDPRGSAAPFPGSGCKAGGVGGRPRRPRRDRPELGLGNHTDSDPRRASAHAVAFLRGHEGQTAEAGLTGQTAEQRALLPTATCCSHASEQEAAEPSALKRTATWGQQPQRTWRRARARPRGSCTRLIDKVSCSRTGTSLVPAPRRVPI